MKKKISKEELLKRSAEQTEELIATMNRLFNWIEDAHQPSTGSYLESLIRSHLRRRLPNRFSVSTGFISSIGQLDENNFERIISNQFDILVWDSYTYPPLFKNDDFVIIMPQSCYAIIEVTNTLNAQKLREDIQKLNNCFHWYRCYRQKFNPFTAIVGFNSNSSSLEKVTEKLLETLIFNHEICLDARYDYFRKFSDKQSSLGFPNAVCVIDKGLIYSKPMNINNRFYILYQGAYSSQVDSFGLFEKKLLLNILEHVDNSVKFFEYDLYSEFLHASGENRDFFSIAHCPNENIPFDLIIQHDTRLQDCGKYLEFKYNQKSVDGLKTGYWLEDAVSVDGKCYGKYVKGKKHGLWSCYSQDEDYLITEQYNNGELIRA